MFTDDLAREQDGVLTIAQAHALYGRGYVRAQLTAHRWAGPAHGVLVLHNGPPTPTQLDWIALFACAPGSVLGGRSGLTADGLKGFEPDVPDVVQPMGARRPPYGEVVPHWSSQLADTDVHPLHRPPRTRTPRSAVDAASWEHNERYARAIVLATVQQRLTNADPLADVVARRGNLRHRALIRESIGDARGGKHSLPERDFDGVRGRWHLPEPTRQSVRRGKNAIFYLDVEWHDYGTACEIHGIPHMYVANWSDDLLRANEISILGPRMLVFTSYAVRRQQAVVADQLVRMLRRGGWSG